MEMEAAVNNADERVSGINDDLAKTLKVAVRLQNINCLILYYVNSLTFLILGERTCKVLNMDVFRLCEKDDINCTKIKHRF